MVAGEGRWFSPERRETGLTRRQPRAVAPAAVGQAPRDLAGPCAAHHALLVRVRAPLEHGGPVHQLPDDHAKGERVHLLVHLFPAERLLRRAEARRRRGPRARRGRRKRRRARRARRWRLGAHGSDVHVAAGPRHLEALVLLMGLIRLDGSGQGCVWRTNARQNGGAMTWREGRAGAPLAHQAVRAADPLEACIASDAVEPSIRGRPADPAAGGGAASRRAEPPRPAARADVLRSRREAEPQRQG